MSRRCWFNGFRYDDEHEAYWHQMLNDAGHDVTVYPNGRNRPPDFRDDQGWGPLFYLEIKGDMWDTAGLKKFGDQYGYGRSNYLNIWLFGGIARIRITDADDRICGPHFEAAGICDPIKNNGADTLIWADMPEGNKLILPYGTEWPVDALPTIRDRVQHDWLHSKDIVKHNPRSDQQYHLPLPTGGTDPPPTPPTIGRPDDEDGRSQQTWFGSE